MDNHKETEYAFRPALFLDFDGTIRYSKSGKKFIDSPDDAALYPDVEKKLALYGMAGFLIMGITNQGGVAFGIRTKDEVAANIKATLMQFEQDPFLAVYMCYSHPRGTVEGLAYESLLRKPNIGMLVLAEIEAAQHQVIIDWKRSLLVGDSEDDRGCAQRAGIEFQWAYQFFDRPEPKG